MEAPCVRVPREAGEEARQALAAAGVLEQDLEIDLEDGHLHIPVTDPGDVPEGYEVVRREVEPREGQTTPTDHLAFDPTYERLGDVAIVDEDDPERAREVAAAITASDLPVKTVLRKASKVKGEQRTRDWEVLAGDGTETVHREYGFEFALDPTEVYFSPRLATERHRVVETVAAGERAVDMFAGVGPFAVPFAARGAEVVATDINGAAVEYLRENARRNGVADRITAIHGDVRAVADDYRGWADRIVMNLPHSADAFLDTAVAIARDGCLLHYYDIQPDGAPFEAGEAAIAAAASDGGYVASIEGRRRVRSYAPHEVNVRLDARLEAR
ncbi:MAG: class I SAM-dependent methyltransferase family protein [Halobacteriales archaeon]